MNTFFYRKLFDPANVCACKTDAETFKDSVYKTSGESVEPFQWTSITYTMAREFATLDSLCLDVIKTHENIWEHTATQDIP